jgi:hypothetical protein
VTAQKIHREDVACQVVAVFLREATAHAEYLQRLFRDFSQPNPPFSYYLSHTSDELEIIELQELLSLPDDDIVDWVNELGLLEQYDLEFALVARCSDIGRHGRLCIIQT